MTGFDLISQKYSCQLYIILSLALKFGQIEWVLSSIPSIIQCLPLARIRDGKECMHNYLPVSHLSVQKADQCP